jgi:CDP-diglyceride synthetase
MKELFGLFAQIAMSRKGPQDLPASYLLLALTVLAYWVIRYAVSLAAPPAEHWRVHLLVQVVFTLAWYAVLLRAVGKPERFVQAATAIFGAWMLLEPPWVVAVHYWQGLPEQDALYGLMAILALAITIWIIRAGSYVLKHALELPLLACVILTILQTFTGEMLMRAASPPSTVTHT